MQLRILTFVALCGSVSMAGCGAVSHCVCSCVRQNPPDEKFVDFELCLDPEDPAPQDTAEGIVQCPPGYSLASCLDCNLKLNGQNEPIDCLLGTRSLEPTPDPAM